MVIVAGGWKPARPEDRRPRPGRMSGVQHNPVLAASHGRLKEAGKAPEVALIATTRKLLTTLNPRLRTGQTWTQKSHERA